MRGVCYGLLTILALYSSWVLFPIVNGVLLVSVGVRISSLFLFLSAGWFRRYCAM
jgi:hypothetical protein